MKLKMLNDIVAVCEQLVVAKQHRVNKYVDRRAISFIIYIDDQAFNTLALNVVQHFAALVAVVGKVECIVAFRQVS